MTESTMPDYIDYRWYGQPAAVEAGIAGLPNVIGPEVLDGIAYCTVRSATPLTLPPGVAEMGPNLSVKLLGVWAGQVPDAPQVVTNFQARAVLRSTFAPDGRSLETTVNDMLRAAKDAAADLPESDPARMAADRAWLAWEQSNVFERNGALVTAMAAQLGISDAEMDALFRAAAQVSA